MRFILIEIVKGNLVVLFLYLVSYIIEKMTKLSLLVWNLRQTKNRFMAHGAANIAAIVYFIINLISIQFTLERMQSIPEGYSFLKWLMIMGPLTVAFRIIHFRLTPIDLNRENFDFS